MCSRTDSRTSLSPPETSRTKKDWTYDQRRSAVDTRSALVHLRLRTNVFGAAKVSDEAETVTDKSLVHFKKGDDQPLKRGRLEAARVGG
ncbi:uncharacterized [Tachysurus ichikawai]